MATQTLTAAETQRKYHFDISREANDSERNNGSETLSAIDGFMKNLSSKSQAVLNMFFSPEQRDELLGRLRAFMVDNPKISAFVGIQMALSGIPLATFALFSLTVAVSSVLTGLVVGLLSAALFTVFWVGVALSVLIPTIFFTTITACFISFWALVGYHLLQTINRRNSGSSAKPRSGDVSNGVVSSSWASEFTNEEKRNNVSGRFTENHEIPNPAPQPQGEDQSTVSNA